MHEVAGGGLAGALAIIFVWALRSFFPNLDIPAEVESAITTVFSSVGAWIAARAK
jgi:hypothetical protein